MLHESPFSRTELLLGPESMERLGQSRVAIFGVGGVGGHCAETLARCGVGRFLLIDKDTVSLSNLNRQAVALHSTLGRSKVSVMAERILDINPTAQVDTLCAFYGPDGDLGVWGNPPDLAIDAIDTVSAKVDLVSRAQALGVPCISCMGAGNKLDPTQFEVADLYSTSVCPLCRAMRKQARPRGVTSLPVVYSKEPPAPHRMTAQTHKDGRPVPGSVAYVTASAGLLLAAEAVRMLLFNKL